MTKLKPCPFCGRELTKLNARTKTLDNLYEVEEYTHPANDCFMHCNIGWFSLVDKEDFEAWNRRADND